MDRNWYGDRAPAAERFQASELCRRVASAIDAVKAARDAVAEIGESRSFRTEMVAVHGPEPARAILEDWRAGVWTLEQIYGVLNSTATLPAAQ